MLFREKKKAKFTLGTKGKDILSGFVGRLEERAEYITGCDQYLLKAEALPGKGPASNWVDEGLIEILDENVIGNLEVKETEGKYKLGQKVKDKISGFEGALYARTQKIFGEDRYCIMGKALPGKEPVHIWINEGAVEVMPEPRIKPKQTKEEKENGGPRLTPPSCGI